MNHSDKEIDAILHSLEDNSTLVELELLMMLEMLAEKLTRRQAIILRIMLMCPGVTQTTISKMLGYSASTINLDIVKIRQTLTALYREEGRDISKLLNINDVNNIKDTGVFISEEEDEQTA